VESWVVVVVVVVGEGWETSCQALQKRVRATHGYAIPATRGTSPGPPQRLPSPVFSKNRK